MGTGKDGNRRGQPSRVNPERLNRTETPDHIVIYDIPSKSSPGTFKHPIIDLNNGRVDCPQCEDYEMRRLPAARDAGVHIDIGTVAYHCIHIKRAIADCIYRGEIGLVIPEYKEKSHE